MKHFTLSLLALFLLTCCTSRFDRENPAESWEASQGGLTIHISAHLEKGVFPILKGAYYVYSATSVGSDVAVEIMTARLDDPVPIDPGSVRFLNDDVCYVFLGSQYSVTTDRGRSWTGWNSEKELSNDQGLGSIRRVEIQSDGKGEMELGIYPAMCQYRTTSDYGKSWILVRTNECTDYVGKR